VRINTAVPEEHVSKPILDASLEAVTRLDEALVEAREVPPMDQVMNRIRWKPEPPGDEHFDHAKKILKRGHGDCDDMAPYWAATLRATGKDPGAKAVVRRSGPKMWHAIVQRSNGKIDDPSKWTGMPTRKRNGPPGVGAAILDPLGNPYHDVGTYIARPKLLVRPVRKGPWSSEVESWQARADLPWHFNPGNSPADIAMASLHQSPVASQAVVGAVLGAIQLGEESGFVDGETLNHADAVRMCCEGASWNEIAEVYGDDLADDAYEQVGGLFKKIGKGLKKIASPITKAVTSKAGRGLISMIPGVGPAAATALDMAGPALNKMAQSKDPPKGSSGITKPVGPGTGGPFGSIMSKAKAAAEAAQSGPVGPKKKKKKKPSGRVIKSRGRKIVRATVTFPFPE